MNRLLSCEPWPVSKLTVLLSQFLEGIISLFVTFRRWLFCRRLFCLSLGARFCRALCVGLCRRLLGGGLFLRRLVALFTCCRRHLFLLRPRADGGLGVVGENLGDAKHRELVAIAALAPRVLAPPLL